MQKILVTCDPGLEDIAEQEIKENFPHAKVSRFFDFQGKLLVEIGRKYEKMFTLHSIHHIIALKKEFYLEKPTLEEIRKALQKIDIEEMDDVETFRVTSQRFGNHAFTSIDMQKIAGEVFLEKYKKKVSLKNFDLNIRFDLIGNFAYVGIQLTRDSLYKRFKKVFNHPAAIKSTLAYGMIRLADMKYGESFLDPMCGSGTIALEAASLFKNKIKIFAGDIREEYVEKAKENAKANGLDAFIEFKPMDATKLEEYFASIDKIVTNPPYGVKIAKKKDLKAFYWKFLESVSKVLSKEGRAVLINLKANMFRTLIIRVKAFKIVHERVVESGGIFPHIFVLERI
jgi:tRNA (guanine6-N2)-methyltransferase